MPTANMISNNAIAGININGSIILTKTGQIGQDGITLNKGNSGTLSTRTDDTTGTATLGASHTIQTGDIVDIYFGTSSVQYKATVGTVAGTSVPFSLGSGDVLPTQDDTVIISKRTTVDIDVSGTLIEAIAAKCDKACRFAFNNGSGEISGAQFQTAANQPWSWYNGNGYTNPLTGESIISVDVSTKDIVANGAFQLGLLYDSSSED